MKACRAINSRFGLFFNLDLSEIEVNLMITELISTYEDDINCDITRDELLQFLSYAKEQGLHSPTKMFYDHLY